VGEVPNSLRGSVDVLVASYKYWHKGTCFSRGSSKKYSSLEFTLVRRN
jgi:hypothetical protein